MRDQQQKAAQNGEVPPETPAMPDQPLENNPVITNQLSPRQVTLEDILNGFSRDSRDVPEDAKNKIISAINSCSDANLFSKSMEIKNLISTEPIIYWFARYLISQKAPKESSRHETFISLVEKMNRKEVFNAVTKETYNLFNMVIDNLMNLSEKAVLNAKDKNVLKNLGSWLGFLTIARNKPIIMKEFDIKTLIMNAHESKSLIMCYLLFARY